MTADLKNSASDGGLPAVEVTSGEVFAMHSRGSESWLLLDCRTPEEHATARIAGAVLIPMQEISARLGEIEAWRDKPIIVHCHHGVRSLRVVQWLRQRGFAHAQSMRGGIEAWSLEVDPSVPRY